MAKLTPAKRVPLGQAFHAENAARALLELIPGIGPSLSQFIFGPLDEVRARRLEGILLGVAQELKRIGATDAVTSERWVALLEEVAPSAARAVSEERQERFRDLLVNAAARREEDPTLATGILAAEILRELRAR